jgi:hypothetical protein
MLQSFFVFTNLSLAVMQLHCMTAKKGTTEFVWLRLRSANVG